MNRVLTAREANQQFSKVLADIERGDTVLITKHGRAVAEMRPRTGGRRDDPEWQAAHARMVASMRAAPATGHRVGKLSEDDKYGDAPE